MFLAVRIYTKSPFPSVSLSLVLYGYFLSLFHSSSLWLCVCVFLCQSICLTMSNVTKYKKRKRYWKLFTQMTTISFPVILHSLWMYMKAVELQMEDILFMWHTYLYIYVQRWNFVWNGNHAKMCCQIPVQKEKARKKEINETYEWTAQRVFAKTESVCLKLMEEKRRNV